MMYIARDDAGSLHRNLRTITSKTAKEMDQKHTRIAALTVHKGHLEAKLASQRPQKRRKVQYDPNADFPGVPEIVKARERAQRTRNKARRLFKNVAEKQGNNIDVANPY
jgi:hypothetical protein